MDNIEALARAFCLAHGDTPEQIDAGWQAHAAEAARILKWQKALETYSELKLAANTAGSCPRPWKI